VRVRRKRTTPGLILARSFISQITAALDVLHRLIELRALHVPPPSAHGLRIWRVVVKHITLCPDAPR
jgi:hypothetical protein